jgi:hypothetical protein
MWDRDTGLGAGALGLLWSACAGLRHAPGSDEYGAWKVHAADADGRRGLRKPGGM